MLIPIEQFTKTYTDKEGKKIKLINVEAIQCLNCLKTRDSVRTKDRKYVDIGVCPCEKEEKNGNRTTS